VPLPTELHTHELQAHKGERSSQQIVTLIQLPGVDVTIRSPAEELWNPAKVPMDRRTLTIPNATIDPIAGHLPLAFIRIPICLWHPGKR